VRITDNFKFMRVGHKAQKAPERNAASLQNPDIKAVLQAAEELTQIVDPGNLLDPEAGPRRPLLLLAFDESHVLTDIPGEQGWSLFSELRRALHAVVGLPIFSLFLSTASKFRLFSPEIQSDQSHLGVNLNLPLLHPISEISFDDLAFPAIEGSVMLDKVIENKISHLGRPL
jgi:hypothetical protein